MRIHMCTLSAQNVLARSPTNHFSEDPAFVFSLPVAQLWIEHSHQGTGNSSALHPSITSSVASPLLGRQCPVRAASTRWLFMHIRCPVSQGCFSMLFSDSISSEGFIGIHCSPHPDSWLEGSHHGLEVPPHWLYVYLLVLRAERFPVFCCALFFYVFVQRKCNLRSWLGLGLIMARPPVFVQMSALFRYYKSSYW